MNSSIYVLTQLTVRLRYIQSNTIIIIMGRYKEETGRERAEEDEEEEKELSFLFTIIHFYS